MPACAGIVFESSGERESLSLAWHKQKNYIFFAFFFSFF
jgi:hypothetical protein